MKHRFSARVYTSPFPDDLKEQMARIGAETSEAAAGRPAGRCVAVKAHGLPAADAVIVRTALLSCGGDCFIHRDCEAHKIERSDALIMGSEGALQQALAVLRDSLPDSSLAEEISGALARFGHETPAFTALAEMPDGIRRMYSKLGERTLIMGILNVTPDSFADGGLHCEPGTAVEHAVRMVDDGADLLDIGGESSRPGADPVSANEELSRVLPVITRLSSRVEVPISIDTCKPEVARAALDAGASVINDITGLSDPEMRSLAAERKAPCVVMHMRGTPRTMQTDTSYDDVVSEVLLFLSERVGEAVSAGLREEYIIVDPGIGFGKSPEHNLEIIRMLGDFRSLGRPILVGPSRKGFVGKYAGGARPDERLLGTAASVALAIANGASIVRVHDVKEMVQVARMADAVVRGGNVALTT